MIDIDSNTSIEDIDKKWVAKNNRLEFVLKASSSFQVLAESYAVSSLRKLHEDGLSITVIIHDSDKLKCLLDGSDDFFDHSILSIFGMQLIFVSKFVAVKSNEIEDIRSKLGNAIWRYLLASNLTVGAGRKVQYVSNHMHPVPPIFGGERKINRYANYQSFKAEVSKWIANAWSAADRLSDHHIDRISGIAFHASENAYDHGRYNGDKKIRGYYGLTLEKFIFQNVEDIRERQALPELIKNYLIDNCELVRLGSLDTLKVQVVTISDIGNSIQHTLKVEGLSAIPDVVSEAFKDQVTSKLHYDDEQPGFGLGDIVSLAGELKSLLYIRSGSYEFYQDFSDEPERMTREQKRKVDLSVISENRKNGYGTCLSLIWIAQRHQVQPSLFGDGV